MKTILRFLLPMLLIAVSGAAAAEDGGNSDDALDITMTVVEDRGAVGEEDFFNEIELPDITPEQAQLNAQHGLETASEARREGLEVGQERAEEGRSRGGGGNRGRRPIDLPTP